MFLSKNKPDAESIKEVAPLVYLLEWVLGIVGVIKALTDSIADATAGWR